MTESENSSVNEESSVLEEHVGLITTDGDSRPRVSAVEFSMVVGVFVLCAISLLLLYVYPRDWKADDERNKQLTIELMGKLYKAVFTHMDEYKVDTFPVEMDNFLRKSPLEWITLGICPASHRRYSIQFIPGWTREDVEKHPKMLFAYDYNEDELKFKNMGWDRVTVKILSENSNEEVEKERATTVQEKIAILTGDYSIIEDTADPKHGLKDQLRVIRNKYLSEGTLARNFSDGHVILLLDGTVKFVSDRIFAQYRLKVFLRELKKLAKINEESLFPSSTAEAIALMFEKDEILQTWWLKNSLSINPGNKDFIGFSMNQQRIHLGDDPKTVVMFDKNSSIHSITVDGSKVGGRNVLFLDGTVEFLTEIKFQKLMNPEDFAPKQED